MSIDFGDEDEVLHEMSKALDIPEEDLKIEEDRGLTGFGEGTVYSITIRGGGHKEWYVVEDDDQERNLAVAIVTQDLEEQPEIFEQNFIESHIDIGRLRRDLHSDVYDSNYDMCQDEADHDADDFWRRYESIGFEAPEEDEDGERREPTSSEVEDLAEHLTTEQLKDPMQYLEDIYGREDAVKQAIKIAGIDVAAAADEAVSVDGPGHFLSSYDGSTYETPAGLVYWRHN
jgi:hypothetical protein